MSIRYILSLFREINSLKTLQHPTPIFLGNKAQDILESRMFDNWKTLKNTTKKKPFSKGHDNLKDVMISVVSKIQFHVSITPAQNDTQKRFKDEPEMLLQDQDFFVCSCYPFSLISPSCELCVVLFLQSSASRASVIVASRINIIFLCFS